MDLSDYVSRLHDLATNGKSHTRYIFLNHVQLRKLIAEVYATLNGYKLQRLNDGRKLATSMVKLDEYRELFMLVAENNIPHLQQLFQVWMRHGASLRTVINKLGETIEKVYRARGFNKSDMDLALLVYRLGGRRLLFAMRKAIGLPSLRTLRNHIEFTSIMPTIGTINSEQFVHNIKSIVFQGREKSSHTARRGTSLSIDECACTQRATYFKEYNAVGGLCWLHSHRVDPTLRTYESAVSIAEKLVSGDIHLGREISVIAAHCFGEDGTYPILAAPTCKTEDAADMEFIFTKAMDSWTESGADIKVGPIWSFGTDGDATRRSAGNAVFCKTPLAMTSKLYPTLSNLPGLNIFTGDNEVTLNFDYKHIFKRVCTLIRSQAGITLNNGQIIGAAVLSRFLTWLPGHDDASVQRLLHPTDPQDVPRAIDCMKAIIKVSKIALPDDTDVCTLSDMAAIRQLGSLLEALLLPFIDTSMSLSQQIESLSTYAHLAFVFFRCHRRAFMSPQLFGDSQTMVKNMIFCVAKQQQLDPTEPFFLGDVGTDGLEQSFGRMRMAVGHDSSPCYQQSLDRLSAGCDIDAAFLRNPDLDPGHRRLKLTRSEGVDHIHRKLWKGNIISGLCDIPAAWHKGRERAINTISRSQISPLA
ncbi:hypothetical protein BV22DRAFT_1103933 [Leucogyrophana mollusca]|uniref:Uncharacterized protein n=1 Tax=Leucogyrophana mollusca TaxID=85980 RepID=A0ACB8BMZ8_9AGAM|nr:hypothetical protein BV22DRAFT_1103933 [Leucogyrophana mollusca]